MVMMLMFFVAVLLAVVFAAASLVLAPSFLWYVLMWLMPSLVDVIDVDKHSGESSGEVLAFEALLCRLVCSVVFEVFVSLLVRDLG